MVTLLTVEYENSPTMLSWNNGQSDTKMLQLELYFSGRAESKCAKCSLQVPRTLFSEQLNHWRRDYSQLPIKNCCRIRWWRESREPEIVSVPMSKNLRHYSRRAMVRGNGCTLPLQKLFKRDLFVQGLSLKWQEKVLPSAATFVVALHQAHAAKE